ncbi:MAG: MFS transporter [Anaerolineae bacterium]|nr:MFS transporter [Anaerolineae bacterium]
MFRKFDGLWRSPDFMKLWVGQTVSEFGSHITGTGLPLVAVITLAASPSELGVLAALGSVPILLFSLVAGVWVDRLPRRPIMIASDIGRMILLLTVPLAALTGHLSMPLLYIVTIGLSMLTLFFNVAYRSVLPGLVSREHLLEGNTKLATSSSLAEVGGPAIAGLLVERLTAPIAIILDALTFLISALSLGLMRKAEPPSVKHQPESMRRAMRTGFDVILHDPILRALVIAHTLRAFFGSFFAALYSLYVIRELGLTPLALGIIIGAGGVGALIGSVLAERVTQKYGIGTILTLLPLLSAPLGLLTPLAAGPPLLAAGMLMIPQLFGDAMWAIHGINEISLQQALIPDHLLGRANATVFFLSQGIAPIGALLAGAIASASSARFTLLIAIMGFFCIAVWLLTTPVRQVQAVSGHSRTEDVPMEESV